MNHIRWGVCLIARKYGWYCGDTCLIADNWKNVAIMFSRMERWLSIPWYLLSRLTYRLTLIGIISWSKGWCWLVYKVHHYPNLYKFFNYIFKDNRMNSSIFYCLIVCVKRCMMVDLTRFECDFTITRTWELKTYPMQKRKNNRSKWDDTSQSLSRYTSYLNLILLNIINFSLKRATVLKRSRTSTKKCFTSRLKWSVLNDRFLNVRLLAYV